MGKRHRFEHGAPIVSGTETDPRHWIGEKYSRYLLTFDTKFRSIAIVPDLIIIMAIALALFTNHSETHAVEIFLALSSDTALSLARVESMQTASLDGK